jgi:hypothetical protein
MRLIQSFSKEFSKLEQEVKDFFFATGFFFSFGLGFYIWCYFIVFYGGAK